jgi:polar amino acid transport system substrate-binding protein
MGIFSAFNTAAKAIATHGRSAMLGLVVTATAAAVSAPAQASEYWKAIQDRGTLRCAAAISPPYIMKDLKTGEFGGAYLELCKQFAEVLKVKVEFVDTSWDNIIAGLQAGKWDISPGLNRTPARALVVNYSIPSGYDQMNLAYLTSNEKIKGAPADLSTLDESGIRIGVTSGQAGDRIITERFKNAQIVRLPDPNGLNLALLSGRIDIVANDATTNLLLQTANSDKVSLLDPAPALMKQGIAFGFPLSLTAAEMDVFNIFIEEKVALGEVDRMMKHWAEIALQGAK